MEAKTAEGAKTEGIGGLRDQPYPMYIRFFRD
jgi:hypothetical protein